MTSLNIDADDQGKRAHVREPTQVFITIKGHDIYGYEKLAGLVTDVSPLGVSLHTAHPFEVNSFIDIYLAGEYAAHGEVVNVSWDETETNPAKKVRIGVEILEKNENWPY